MRTPLVIITILLAALCGFAVVYTQSVVHRSKASPKTAGNSNNAQQQPRSDATSSPTSPSTTSTTQPAADPPKPVVSDLNRVATAMIESNRPNSYFGEWSHRYLVIRDVLRAEHRGRCAAAAPSESEGSTPVRPCRAESRRARQAAAHRSRLACQVNGLPLSRSCRRLLGRALVTYLSFVCYNSFFCTIGLHLGFNRLNFFHLQPMGKWVVSYA